MRHLTADSTTFLKKVLHILIYLNVIFYPLSVLKIIKLNNHKLYGIDSNVKILTINSK